VLRCGTLHESVIPLEIRNVYCLLIEEFVLYSVAECCRVLQSVAVCCAVLQFAGDP